MSFRTTLAASLAMILTAGTAAIAQMNPTSQTLQPRSGGMNPPLRYAEAVAQPDDPEDFQIRVYDLRSMGDVLSGLELQRARDRAGAAGFAAANTVASLARLVNMMTEPVTDGVYAIAGTAGSHAQFAQTLDQLRSLQSERYIVDLRILTVSSDEPPAVGSSVSTNAPAEVNARVLAAVKERSPASFTVMTETSYIEGWMPVVSDAAIGYQSNVETVMSGLEAEIIIEERTGSGVRLTLRGAISEAEVDERKEPLTGSGLTIGLPIVARRTFDSGAAATFNTGTVVASMSGFEPGEHLIAVVTVRIFE